MTSVLPLRSDDRHRGMLALKSGRGGRQVRDTSAWTGCRTRCRSATPTGRSCRRPSWNFIGRQLDLDGDELADYAVRSETRHEHLAELRRLYGFRFSRAARGA